MSKTNIDRIWDLVIGHFLEQLGQLGQLEQLE
jgi:hypothetical protein